MATHPRRSRVARPLLVLLVAATLAACKLGPGPTEPITESTLTLSGGHTLSLFSRNFTLKTPDGLAVKGAAVVVGDKVFRVDADGRLPLSAADLATARTNGSFLLIADGFAPARIRLDETGDATVILRPLTALGPAALLGPTGGRLAATDGSVAVTMPPGMVRTEANATLSAYAPPAGAATTLAGTARAALLKAVQAAQAQAASGVVIGASPRPDGPGPGHASTPPFAGTGASVASGCDAPLPCPPPVASVGLLLSVNGPVAGGKMLVSYNLEDWLRGWDGRDPAPWVAHPADWTEQQRQQALAAARLMETFRAIDATGNLAWRAALKSEYGLTYDGRNLSFVVEVGDGGRTGGVARVEVDVFALLGVALEITVLSGATGPLPAPLGAIGTGDAAALPTANPAVLPGLLPPSGQGGFFNGAPILSDHGHSVISTGGGGVISTGGGGILSNNGAGIVSNNGGSLVGHVLSALLPDKAPKYKLLAFSEVPLPNLGTVSAVDFHDTPYGASAPIDGASNYRLTNIPATARHMFLRVTTAGNVQLRAFTLAPEATQRTADITTATTAITSWLLDELRLGRVRLDQIKPAGYPLDVAAIAPLLNQTEAGTVVTADVPVVAALVRAKFQAAGLLPASLPLVSTYAGTGAAALTDGPRITAAFTNPVSVGFDAQGALLVADTNVAVRRIDAAGVVTTLARTVATAGPPLDGADGVARFEQPWGVAADGVGNVYFTDHYTGTVRRIATSLAKTAPGYITTVAGDGLATGFADGTGTAARFGLLAGLARLPNGDVVVADYGNHCLRRVTPAGVVTLLAGTPGVGGHVDGAGVSARFNAPSGLSVDGAGNVIVADRDNHAIRHVKITGSTVLVTTLAGGHGAGYGDGQDAAVKFFEPRGVAVDSEGGVYVAEGGIAGATPVNCRVRRILPDARVVTVFSAPGTPGRVPVTAADQVLAENVRVDRPRGIGVAPDGTVYVSDSYNNLILQFK